MKLYPSPFSRDYWHDALGEVRNLRSMVFCALMIAAAIMLGYLVKFPVAPNLNIGISFLARALAAWVGGPILGLLFGFAEDILGWWLHPSGPFFPGYTLNTMLGVLVYALCFYRQKITVWRIIIAKVLTNFPISVGLGCLWSSMLYGKGYLYYLSTSLVKNIAYLPVQILLLITVFQALQPGLAQLGLVSRNHDEKIGWR